METWIAENTAAEGESVQLLPLKSHHFEELEALSKDPAIWEFYVFDGTDTVRFRKELENALLEKEKGRQFPFVIYHKKHRKIIGSTRFLDIQPEHRKLEIGWTWLHPDYWASEVNFECKLLLLTCCFEKLKTVRVQFKTDENNIRSRKAIQKIGGHYEGILRNDMIRADGTLRNSAYYSITEGEWPYVKPVLEKACRDKKQKAGM